MMFELLVKPLLYRMTGLTRKPAMIGAVLGQAYRRKKTERQTWVPVGITESGYVNVVGRKSSGFSYPLCSADGLISIPAGVGYLDAGSPVTVRLLNY
jgi:molybdopterin biosynthesis enzyme